VSVVQTVLVFLLIPAVVYLVVFGLTVGRKASRKPRYRSGEAWDYEPVLWTANPAGAHLPAERSDTVEPTNAQTGGARGHW
jgi:hypothetical protein